MKAFLVAIFVLNIWLLTVKCNNVPEISYEWTEMTKVLEDLNGGTSYHMTVHCTLNRECDLDSRMDLRIEKPDVLLVSEECNAIRSGNSRWLKYWAIEHRVLINDTSIFGNLVCSYRTPDGRSYASQKPVVPPFVFCPPHSSDCANTQCKTNGLERNFCLWTSDGQKNQCRTKFDATWCKSDETKRLEYPSPKRYCPVDKVGLCEALAEDPAKVWYMTTQSKPCLSLASTPISYKGEPLVHGQEFLLDPVRKYIRFDCPHGSPFYDVQVGVMRGGEYPRAGAVCRGALNLSIDDDGRPLVQESWKISAIMDSKPRFEIGVINFEHVKLTLIITDQSGYAEMKCTLHNGPIWFKNNFRISQWWTRTNQNSTRIGLDREPDFSDRVGTSYWLQNVSHLVDEYQCHVTITYKKCSPYYEVSVQISSNRANGSFESTGGKPKINAGQAHPATQEHTWNHTDAIPGDGQVGSWCTVCIDYIDSWSGSCWKLVPCGDEPDSALTCACPWPNTDAPVHRIHRRSPTLTDESASPTGNDHNGAGRLRYPHWMLLWVGLIIVLIDHIVR